MRNYNWKTKLKTNKFFIKNMNEIKKFKGLQLTNRKQRERRLLVEEKNDHRWQSNHHAPPCTIPYGRGQLRIQGDKGMQNLATRCRRMHHRNGADTTLPLECMEHTPTTFQLYKFIRKHENTKMKTEWL